MIWSHPKMPFPQRVRLLFGYLSPSKFGDKISSFADPGCLSRIRIFSIPDPGSWIKIFCILDPWSRIWIFSIPDPGSRMCIKEFKYLKKKKWFLSSQKYDPEFSILDPDPGSGSWLFTYPRSRSWIPDPEFRDQKGTGSLILDPGSGFATMEISGLLRL